MEDQKTIKREMINFYDNLYKKNEEWRPSNRPRLSEVDKEWLQMPFLEREVEEIIRSSESVKTLGL